MITVDPVPNLVLATFRQGLAVGNQGGIAVPDCGDFLLQPRNRATAWLTIIVPVCGIERLEIRRQTFALSAIALPSLALVSYPGRPVAFA